MIIRRLVILLGAILASASSARADSIDGSWCDGQGQHLSILGTRIVTPDGTVTQGRYFRHAFDYVTPERESSSGVAVSMVLVSETTMRMRLGEGGGWQIWTRCEQTS